MPRKKSRGPEQILEPAPLALPPPRPHKHHDHEKDAYEAPPGTVHGRVANERTIQSQPIKRALTAEEKKQQVALQQQQAYLTNRYHTYLDLLNKWSTQVDYREQALAELFGISLDEARIQMYDLIADVHRGKAGSDVTKMQERNDIDAAARAARLRYWMWSDNAAASLKAVDMAREEAGDTSQADHFEIYLRTAKLQKGIK